MFTHLSHTLPCLITYSLPCVHPSCSKATPCDTGIKRLNVSVRKKSGTCAIDDVASDVRVSNGKDDVVGPQPTRQTEDVTHVSEDSEVRVSNGKDDVVELQPTGQAEDVTHVSKANDVSVQTIKSCAGRRRHGTSRHVLLTLCMNAPRALVSAKPQIVSLLNN